MAIFVVIALGTMLVAGALRAIDFLNTRRLVAMRGASTTAVPAWSSHVPIGVAAGVR